MDYDLTMGYDLYGRKNDAYFRNNIWWWGRLWRYVCAVCGDILSVADIAGGGSNGGHYITKPKAKKIAQRLFSLIESGEVLKEAKVIEQYNDMLKTKCKVCKGKGFKPPIGLKEPCDKCEGKGKVFKDDFQSQMSIIHFDKDNVKEFAEFCEKSEGFRIS